MSDLAALFEGIRITLTLSKIAELCNGVLIDDVVYYHEISITMIDERIFVNGFEIDEEQLHCYFCYDNYIADKFHDYELTRICDIDGFSYRLRKFIPTQIIFPGLRAEYLCLNCGLARICENCAQTNHVCGVCKFDGIIVKNKQYDMVCCVCLEDVETTISETTCVHDEIVSFGELTSSF